MNFPFVGHEPIANVKPEEGGRGGGGFGTRMFDYLTRKKTQ